MLDRVRVLTRCIIGKSAIMVIDRGAAEAPKSQASECPEKVTPQTGGPTQSIIRSHSHGGNLKYPPIDTYRIDVYSVKNQALLDLR